MDETHLQTELEKIAGGDAHSIAQFHRVVAAALLFIIRRMKRAGTPFTPPRTK